MTHPTFTVFTPTFNREGTLDRVFQSLSAQTSRDFEWLVVDDGSTDGTPGLVQGWAREASFPIRYLRQENQGKHVAWNHGVQEAAGELFLGLDSDDECVPEALERFAYHWASVPDKQAFSAVTALCKRPDGSLVGDPFPQDVLDSDPLELHYRYKTGGEKWGFHRTDVLRRHPFPVIPGVKFVDEILVWGRIAQHHRTRYVNEPLRIYHEDFAADSISTLTANASKTSPMFLEVFADQLSTHLRYARYAPLEFARAGALFVRHALHERRGPVWQARRLPVSAWPFWVVGMPLGAALYGRDVLRARRAEG